MGVRAEFYGTDATLSKLTFLGGDYDTLPSLLLDLPLMQGGGAERQGVREAAAALRDVLYDIDSVYEILEGLVEQGALAAGEAEKATEASGHILELAFRDPELEWLPRDEALSHARLLLAGCRPGGPGREDFETVVLEDAKARGWLKDGRGGTLDPSHERVAEILERALDDLQEIVTALDGPEAQGCSRVLFCFTF